jgi:hypothetical protein
MLNDTTNAYMYDRNPFITLIENARPVDDDTIRTVFSVAHYDVESIAKLYRAFTSTPQWLQVIHDENAANEFKGECPTIVDARVKDWFSLRPERLPSGL